MTLLEIPDSMAKAVLRFVSILERTGIHEKTLKHWFDKQLAWAETEAQKIDPLTKNVPIMPRARLHSALVASGEGFQSPNGMEVSQRCLDWVLAAYLRQEGNRAFQQLGDRPEQDYWWFITERLPDAALDVLSEKLENEYLERFKNPHALNISAD